MTNIQVNEKRNALRQYLIGESERLEKTMNALLIEIHMDSNENNNSTAQALLQDKEILSKYHIVHFTGIQFHSAYGHVVQSRKSIQTVGGITQ